MPRNKKNTIELLNTFFNIPFSQWKFNMLGLSNIFQYRRYKFLLWLSVPRFDNERSFHKLRTYLRFRFRVLCRRLVDQRWFDNVVLFFIGLNCITLAMERPNIPPDSGERLFLSTANYIFTAVFAVEMFIKVTKKFWYLRERERGRISSKKTDYNLSQVVASGMLYGSDAYFTSGWNIMDGVLVIISIIDLSMSLLSASSPRIFGILRVRFSL